MTNNQMSKNPNDGIQFAIDINNDIQILKSWPNFVYQ